LGISVVLIERNGMRRPRINRADTTLRIVRAANALAVMPVAKSNGRSVAN